MENTVLQIILSMIKNQGDDTFIIPTTVLHQEAQQAEATTWNTNAYML